MTTLRAEEVKGSGRKIIDVREFPEFAAGSIHGSELVPLSEVDTRAASWGKQQPLLTVCRSGRRATDAAQKLEKMGFMDVAVLEGGVQAWEQSGLPLLRSEERPWSLERQVRIVAGSLVVGFGILGLTVSRKFHVGATLVGAGLTFAGITDVCMMGTVLGKMPWNQRSRQ